MQTLTTTHDRTLVEELINRRRLDVLGTMVYEQLAKNSHAVEFIEFYKKTAGGTEQLRNQNALSLSLTLISHLSYGPELDASIRRWLDENPIR